jgi:hypothetical protein
VESDGLAGNVSFTRRVLGQLGDAKVPGRKHVRGDLASELDQSLDLRASSARCVSPHSKVAHDIAERTRAPIRTEDLEVGSQGGFRAVEIEAAERASGCGQM